MLINSNARALKLSGANGTSKLLVGMLIVSVLTNIFLAARLQFPQAWYQLRLAMIPPPQLTAADSVRGPKYATTTVIVYTNYQCSYCAKLNADLLTLSAELDFRWAYRHYTDKNQVLAFKAAGAAQCAGNQGKFWEYNDHVFAAAKTLNEEQLLQIAKQLQLDMSDFTQCTSAKKNEDRLATIRQQAEDKEITATPTYFINGKRHVGSKPYAELKQLMLKASADV